MIKKLLMELRSFAETTSLRGIPRVMKAKTKVAFIVWKVAVLTCAALLVWQLSVVITRYFQYPINTLTVQAPPWQLPTFPDISVCNIDPLVYLSAEFATFNNNSAGDIFYYDYEYYNGSIRQAFSYTKNKSPLIEFNYFYWSGSQFLNASAEILAAWDPTYYKCFTIRQQNVDREITRGFYAILYVDQTNSQYDEDRINMQANFGTSVASGLRVLVHAPGTAPDMTFGISIAPGTETNIQLTQSVRSRLGQPYSNCTDKPYLPWDNTSDTYTQQYCVNTCVQQYIVDHCRCISQWVPQYTMAQQRQANFQLCNIASVNFEQGVYYCDVNILFNSSIPVRATCNAQCVLPCSELKYDVTASAVAWPQASVLDWYSCMYLSNLSNSDYRYLNLFSVIPNKYPCKFSNPSETSVAVDFFKSTFLQLNVQFGDPTFIELKDVAAFSVDAMGAQIGGVLSLWLGVTVMFAFEVFEFLYNYLTNCYEKVEPTQARSISVAPAIGSNLSDSVVVQIE